MSAVGVSESVVRPILAEAVDLARRALLELEPVGVGAHLGVTAEDESSATHHFEATLPGYRGWQWAVVVAAPPEAGHATVSESALLPGPDALVAPDFIPWDQRVRPGDLSPGDLLATPADDPRLLPGYLLSGDPVVDEVALELGLGRPRVLSREGREEAADRWFSEYGPDTDMARAAPGTCGVCGFFVPLAGSFRSAFGVCANAMGADGHVVHMNYGCGAHSDVEVPSGQGSPLYEAYDDAAVEIVPAEELRKPEPDPLPTEPADAALSVADSVLTIESLAAAAAAAETASVYADAVAEIAAADAAVLTAAVADTAADAGAVTEATETAAAETAAADTNVVVTAVVVEAADAAPDTEPEIVEVVADTDTGAVTLFDTADPDARYDDAWAVTAVKVEPETGAEPSDDSGISGQ